MEWRKLSDPRSGGSSHHRHRGCGGSHRGGLGRLGGSNRDTPATLVLAQARVNFRLAPASQAGACHGAIGQWGGMGGRGGMGGSSSWLGARSCWLGGMGRMGGPNPDTIATLVLAQAQVHFRLAPASKAERGRGERGHPR